MSDLAKLGDSVGVKVLGGSCTAKYGGRKGKRTTKKERKSKKSKKFGKRKTTKRSFLERLFRV